MLIVGIDPGLSGGIAILGLSGTCGRTQDSLKVEPMPVQPHISGKGSEINSAKVFGLIREAWDKELNTLGDYVPEPLYVFIERVGNVPRIGKGGKAVKMGATSMFNFGDGFGKLRAVFETLGDANHSAKVFYPWPQAWQKVVFPAKVKGAAKVNPKKKALSFVTGKYPDVSLLRSKRCKKPHAGIVDALCILEYGRRAVEQQTVS